MSHEITTLLGKDSEFEGKLRFDGVLRIDGRFQGEIQSDGTLALGPSAEVEAEVLVRTCVIEGHFSGNLTASESVEIRAPARVKGTVTTPEIQVERGVLLDGKCTMEGMDSQDAGEHLGKGRSLKQDGKGKAESKSNGGGKGSGGGKRSGGGKGKAESKGNGGGKGGGGKEDGGKGDGGKGVGKDLKNEGSDL